MNAMLSQFHFLRPAWLLLLAALPLLLWLWRRRRLASDPWRQVVDPHLLPHLLQGGPGRSSRWPLVLFVSGYALAALSLAGPAFRQLPQPLSRAESALVIAIDLSDRMRAADLKPDRISRVRFKAASLLEARREGQTALVAYAGDAFVVAPLTDDARSLSDLLASLTPETMPVGGQRPERAIKRAQQLLHDAGFARGDLLLFTDRVDERAREAARSAAASGLRVSVLGVGTRTGAPVPLPQGGFAQDPSGAVLQVRLDADSLQALAEAGGGRYAELAPDNRDLLALDLVEPVTEEGNLRSDERTRAEFRDEGPWLLLLLLPVAALAFRRGWLGVVVVGAALALPPPAAQAFDWRSLWQRDDQRAYEALQSGDAARALELARDPALRGSAAYRSGEFDQALLDFAQSRGADAAYNRGNALARAGRYEDALAAYDEALELEPGMEDAIANRQAVEDWLARQEQDQQKNDGNQKGERGEKGEQDQEGEPDESQTQEGDPSDSEQGEPQPGESEQEPQEPSDEDAREPEESGDAQQEFSQQMQQALEQAGDEQRQEQPENQDPRETEKQQAVEQWLRRVPDDPGGLLRRKFAIEHQRRRREGDQGQ